MRNYVTAYLEAMKSGFIKEDVIKRHIQNQLIIDKLLPDSASFFYVVETPAHRYHFLGKQQVNVSGYTNEEFLENGVEFFLQSVHPEDVEILLNQVYPEFSQFLEKAPPAERKKMQFQYNYRFMRKDGTYLNLMEQSYVLECDEAGRPALILGNVIMVGSKDRLPIKVTIKLINGSGLSETIFSKTYRGATENLDSITGREREILRHLAMGKTSKQIGKELFISSHTVDTHRRNLLNKLKCRSVVDLARWSFKNGVL